MDVIFNQNARDFPEKCGFRLDLRTEVKFAAGSTSGLYITKELRN